MSPRSWLRLAVLLVVALVVQASVLDEVVVAGAHPDLLVLFPAAAGVLAGPVRGAVIGFWSGLVADLVVTLPYGLSALVFTLLGFGVGLVLARPAPRELAGTQVAACVAATAIGTVAYAVLAAIVHQPDTLGRAAADAVLVVTLAAILLAYPAIRAMRWVLVGVSPGAIIPSGGSAA